jgi:uncharacterized damage-inducible protein DinB
VPGPVWLQGPVAGVPALLQPVAHALIEADEDVQKLLTALPGNRLWARANGAASVAFHVLHAAGSLDRLFTYARGESLSDAQLAALAAEKTMDIDASRATPGAVAAVFSAAIERALAQLRATNENDVLAPRDVGRAKARSSVLGILTHAGDHTYRHVGQAITTAKLLG